MNYINLSINYIYFILLPVLSLTIMITSDGKDIFISFILMIMPVIIISREVGGLNR